ncbi:hypothetical protein [Caulobacter sp. FWC2]|uniref:hypothetical protein n=1 Tax=Caulobacter sp. FWC2 TaxID=69664 RepID=UPI000C14B296|nr:hypothetical protein [Caulobacter sp. FWC2]PIB92762.1 hypothetical protein CSW62_15020 [Caulobacter sp. FWC2]
MAKPPKDASEPTAGAPDAQAAQAAAAEAPKASADAGASAGPGPEPLKKDAHPGAEKAEDVFRAFEKGRDDAIEAAAKVAPGLKRAAAKGAYMFCYYLAFGAVYSAELVMTAVPENSPIRHGFSDGAEAAKAAHTQHKTAGGGLVQAA